MTPLDYVCGYILDLAIGDPTFLPHPVRGIGKLIERLVSVFKENTSDSFLLLLGGAVTWFTTIAVTGFSVALLLQLAESAGSHVVHIVTIYLVYAVLATRCLHVESARVFAALERRDIEKARFILRNIVSRDTEGLSEEGILKALLETVSENIVDGVASPLFYLVLGGPVLAWMYKAANTLDSMVGYKNERYAYFGKFSAKADDALNYIPARITGLFMLFSCYLINLDWKRGWKMWLRDASKHASPNAGIPEAVLAGALGIQLGGSGSYFGKRVDKPHLGDACNSIRLEHYRKSIRLLYITSLTLFFAGFAIIVI